LEERIQIIWPLGKGRGVVVMTWVKNKGEEKGSSNTRISEKESELG